MSLIWGLTRRSNYDSFICSNLITVFIGSLTLIFAILPVPARLDIVIPPSESELSQRISPQACPQAESHTYFTPAQTKLLNFIDQHYPLYYEGTKDPELRMTSNTVNTVTTLANIHMPKLIYGTAWKKESTAQLVTLAIRKGYRGIDTACQPKHYHEPGVGEAVEELIASQEIQRSDIFLQTKFTSLNGQDPKRLPYDPKASLSDQVQQSLETSLLNLRTTYIDSLVLHSPLESFKDTITVWRVFESFVKSGKVRQLGISNCYDLSTLSRLFKEAQVKPSVIQNRLYKETEFDQGIRQFAGQHGILYQSFWTLTANPAILRDGRVREIARKYGKTPEQIFFSYLINSAGIIPLTGTTNEKHMEEDLEALELILMDEEAMVFDRVINSESYNYVKSKR